METAGDERTDRRRPFPRAMTETIRRQVECRGQDPGRADGDAGIDTVICYLSPPVPACRATAASRSAMDAELLKRVDAAREEFDKPMK